MTNTVSENVWEPQGTFFYATFLIAINIFSINEDLDFV